MFCGTCPTLNRETKLQPLYNSKKHCVVEVKFMRKSQSLGDGLLWLNEKKGAVTSNSVDCL